MQPFPVRADEVLELADHLVERQEYDSAITEYQRYLFFNPEGEHAGEIYYRIALAYRALGSWDESIQAFSSSIKRDTDPVSRREKCLELALTCLAARQYERAFDELDELSQTAGSAELKHQVAFFQGVAHLYLFDWEAARTAFARFYADAGEAGAREEGKQIDALLTQAEALPYKSERLGSILSAFLPGAGQAYAGQWKKGLNALAVNSLTTFAVLHSAAGGDYVDAALLLALVFNRYYLGNRYHAERTVEEYNDRLNREHAARVLAVLLGNSATLTPRP